ncbi:MAG: response regulator transcription factor [Ignavibacteriales bacterium]|nr:response regulator transcription factor [Ignavibacteriales bacterium]
MDTKKILLVDDEKDIVEFLSYSLEQEGFDVICGFNGLDALKKLSEKPDLIVLDIMMPKLDGFEACKKIRGTKGFENTPIIFLTAKAGEANEIKGLEIGANDYIQKPISPKKLIARVKSNLRNVEQLTEKRKLPSILKIGPLIIDRDKYIIYVNGELKIFPRKEFELLYFLAQNPGRVFGREILLKEVWGNDVFVVDRTVDVHIRKIREKLAHFDYLIETIKGVGYRFKSEE